MVLRGHIENGVVVFSEPVPLPNGTPVQVEPVAPETAGDESSSTNGDGHFLRQYQGVIGSVDDLPEDAAQNVDHYLYGHPKK
jgi:hypothetical protein